MTTDRARREAIRAPRRGDRILPSMSEAFVRELRAAAQAGVPIVCVVTHEERRAVTLVGEALRGARVLEWTATRGLERRRDGAERARGHRAGEPRRETGVARVMLDMHPWLSDPRVVRALRDLAAHQARPAARARHAGGHAPAGARSGRARHHRCPCPTRDAARGAASRPRSSTRGGRGRPSSAPRSASRSTRRARLPPRARRSRPGGGPPARHRREAGRPAAQRVPRAHRGRRDARRRGRARGPQGVAARARAGVRRGRAASSASPSRAGCSCAACRAAASRSSARPPRASWACRSCGSTSPRSSRRRRPSTPSTRRRAPSRPSRPVVLWVDEIEKGLGADGRRRAARARLRRVPHVAAGARGARSSSRRPRTRSSACRRSSRAADASTRCSSSTSPRRRSARRSSPCTCGPARTRRRRLPGRGAGEGARALVGRRDRADGDERALPRVRREARAHRRRTCAPPRASSSRWRRSTRRRSRRCASGGRRARAGRRPTGGRWTCSAD